MLSTSVLLWTQRLLPYNYADADGNTNSDSNFDFTGDVLWLDPRSPNQEATQPGLIEHLFKVAGSYNFDNGFQLGASYRWNSGAIISRTQLAFRRHLPDQGPTFEFAGFTPGAGVGFHLLRGRYEWTVSGGLAYQRTQFDSVRPGDDGSEDGGAVLFSSYFEGDLTSRVDFTAEYRLQV